MKDPANPALDVGVWTDQARPEPRVGAPPRAAAGGASGQQWTRPNACHLEDLSPHDRTITCFFGVSPFARFLHILYHPKESQRERERDIYIYTYHPKSQVSKPFPTVLGVRSPERKLMTPPVPKAHLPGTVSSTPPAPKSPKSVPGTPQKGGGSPQKRPGTLRLM